MAHEQFNLDRKISVENMVDPTGKKWEIHGKRGSALVHARPNPDRKDAQIPKEFAGDWTSPQRLKDLVKMWLNRMWDKAEAEQIKRARRSYMDESLLEFEKPEEVVKQTPEESLASLDPEIAAELGDVIEIKEETDGEDKEEPVAEAEEPVPAKADTNKGTSRGKSNTGRKKAAKKKAAK